MCWYCRLGTEATGTGKRKKRKKQKIQVGKGTGSLATGSKTVFDASGRALDSLEVLQSAREVRHMLLRLCLSGFQLKNTFSCTRAILCDLLLLAHAC